MRDTIELLEAIGKDASLRRAPGEELAQRLDGLGAGEGLKRAAATGDSSHLREEFGDARCETPNHPTNVSQTVPPEEEEEEEKEKEAEPGKDDAGKDKDAS